MDVTSMIRLHNFMISSLLPDPGFYCLLSLGGLIKQVVMLETYVTKRLLVTYCQQATRNWGPHGNNLQTTNPANNQVIFEADLSLIDSSVETQGMTSWLWPGKRPRSKERS